LSSRVVVYTVMCQCWALCDTSLTYPSSGRSKLLSRPCGPLSGGGKEFY